MKQIILLLFIALLVSCDNTNKSGQRQPRPIVARVVQPTVGVNKTLKVVRYVDTLYQVGDTVQVDLTGISGVNEAVIIK